MKDETRSTRGATAGLGKAFLAARTETYALPPASLQAQHLTTRYGLSPAVAATVAALAYGQADNWRIRA